MTPRTRTSDLAALVAGLPHSQRRGSRARCVLLTHGTELRVADRLSALAAPALVVSASDHWAPRGFGDIREVTLGACPEEMVPAATQAALTHWWLATRGRLPTWDLVSTGRAEGRPALLLVEAKAHVAELEGGTRGGVSVANRETIDRALDEATAALAAVVPGWDLRRAPYQLANRIAWAWKLASVGIPVVLVYLGFLHATEMSDRGAWFLGHAEWDEAVRRHGAHGVPAEAWGRRLPVGDAWLRLETRSTLLPLPLPCPRCGGQLRWVVYGLPSPAMAAAEGGGFVLGGCCGDDGMPTHTCEKCGERMNLDGHAGLAL